MELLRWEEGWEGRRSESCLRDVLECCVRLVERDIIAIRNVDSRKCKTAFYAFELFELTLEPQQRRGSVKAGNV